MAGLHVACQFQEMLMCRVYVPYLCPRCVSNLVIYLVILCVILYCYNASTKCHNYNYLLSYELVLSFTTYII